MDTKIIAGFNINGISVDFLGSALECCRECSDIDLKEKDIIHFDARELIGRDAWENIQKNCPTVQLLPATNNRQST